MKYLDGILPRDVAANLVGRTVCTPRYYAGVKIKALLYHEETPDGLAFYKYEAGDASTVFAVYAPFHDGEHILSGLDVIEVLEDASVSDILNRYVNIGGRHGSTAQN